MDSQPLSLKASLDEPRAACEEERGKAPSSKSSSKRKPARQQQQPSPPPPQAQELIAHCMSSLQHQSQQPQHQLQQPQDQPQQAQHQPQHQPPVQPPEHVSSTLVDDLQDIRGSGPRRTVQQERSAQVPPEQNDEYILMGKHDEERLACPGPSTASVASDDAWGQAPLRSRGKGDDDSLPMHPEQRRWVAAAPPPTTTVVLDEGSRGSGGAHTLTCTSKGYAAAARRRGGETLKKSAPGMAPGEKAQPRAPACEPPSDSGSEVTDYSGHFPLEKRLQGPQYTLTMER